MQAVWDPEGRRPHMAFTYVGEQASEHSEELLLDYGFLSYWSEQV